MKELLPLLCERLRKRLPVVLASLIADEGSTPRAAGADLLADADGLLAGTVGGGLGEAKTLEACREALKDGKARLLDFALQGEFSATSAMICGGRMRVLVEPLSVDPNSPRFFQAVLDSLQNEGALLITDVTDTERPLRAAYINGACIGAAPPERILEGLLAAVQPLRESSVQCMDGREYILEECRPSRRMFIAGGGHVALPTAQIAAATGFEVTVIDDRPEFSRPDRFPWAARTRLAPEYTNCFADYAPDARDYIVIVTRGHRYDGAVLAQALKTRAGYIGMIGSARKREQVYAALYEQGMNEKDLTRVSCPVGLSIGAETPEEIAVSIVAECIAHRRQGACPSKHTPR